MRGFYVAIALLSLLSLAAIGTAGYLYWKSRPSPAPSSTVDKVAALIELPAGEDPTIVTITDKTKLADQPFFAPAENGDIVLIYATAKKAYLYRPSTNKIIDVAPLNISESNTQPSPKLGEGARRAGEVSPTSSPTP